MCCVLWVCEHIPPVCSGLVVHVALYLHQVARYLTHPQPIKICSGSSSIPPGGHLEDIVFSFGPLFAHAGFIKHWHSSRQARCKSDYLGCLVLAVAFMPKCLCCRTVVFNLLDLSNQHNTEKRLGCLSFRLSQHLFSKSASRLTKYGAYRGSASRHLT